MKNCAVCKVEFQPKTWNAKLCSLECRVKYYKRTPKGLANWYKARKRYVSNWRRNTKIKAIEYMGGKCKLCGYNRYVGALEFHHLDPNKKDFSISSSGDCRSWKSIQAELDKCIILCSNCHREVHSGVAELVIAFDC